MNYPLFLSYKSAIIGNGFVAEITATGRLLATVEAEGWWLYGVNPGGIAAEGRSLDDAHTAMRESLRLVFVDFAQESPTFEEFKARVSAFFYETDDETVGEWQEAVTLIRAAQSAPNTMGLPRRQAETEPAITVILRPSEQLTPAMNTPALNVPRAFDSVADAELAAAA